jgi:putative SOS response-associated peptidase YedK
MPVILPPDASEVWLDPAIQHPVRLQPLLRPYRAEEMAPYPVCMRVNFPRNDDPGCVQSVV